MVEPENLDDGLCEVDEVIAAADVRQLVREYRLKLLDAQAGNGADRQQDHRLDPSDDRRHVDQRRSPQSDRAADAQSSGQFGRSCVQRRGDFADQSPFHPLQLGPAAQVPGGKPEDAQQPAQHQPGQGRFQRGGDPLHPGHVSNPLRRLRNRRVERLKRQFHHLDGRRPHHKRGIEDRARLRDGPRYLHERHRHQRQSDDQHHRQTRNDVSHIRTAPAKASQHSRQQQRNRRRLPDEVDQRPAQPLDHLLRQQGFQCCHDYVPSISSSISRMRLSSSGETLRADRARMTSFSAEPAKTFSSTSPTTWLCVFSWETAGR